MSHFKDVKPQKWHYKPLRQYNCLGYDCQGENHQVEVG